MGAKGPRDQKRLAELTTVLDSYSIKIQPELKTVIAAAQGYSDYTAGRLWIHHIFFASILDPIIGGRPIEEQAKIIAAVEKNLRGTKLYNNIENLIPLVKELHLNDILSSHGLATAQTDITGKSTQDVKAIRRSGDPKIPGNEAKVYGYDRPVVTTTGKGGGITFDRSWNMQSKHGFSLEQIAKFRDAPVEEVIKAATEYVDLSQDYFRQVNIVSAALSPDQTSRTWAQWLVNNTPDGEKLLKEGIQHLKDNNDKVLNQFTGLDEAAMKKLPAAQKQALSRANQITNRLNQYAQAGPIKYISPTLRGTEFYPDELQDVDNIMDIYRGRATGQLKPGQVNQQLWDFYKAKGWDEQEIQRHLFPTPLDKAKAYAASKLAPLKDIAEEYVGKAWKVLPYSDEATKMFGALPLTLLPGIAGHAAEMADAAGRKEQIQQDPYNPLNYLQWGLSELGVASAKSPTTQGFNLGVNALNLGIDGARSKLGRDLLGQGPPDGYRYKPGSKGMEYEPINEQNTKEIVKTPSEGTKVLDTRESAEDIKEGV